MANLLGQYFWYVLAATGLLLIVTIVTRVKFAKVKKDKRIFTTYSVVLFLVAVLLFAYKMSFFGLVG